MKQYSEEILAVNGIPTQVLVWQPVNSGSHIFVMLPGNPGSPFFYINYLQALFRESGECLHIFCLSHAAHTVGTASSKTYNLREQVLHKIAFVQSLLHAYPSHKIILAGHSIGAFCALEALSEVAHERISRVVLLFPTLMNMKSTRNGIRLSPMFRHGRFAARVAFDLLQCVPKWLRMSIIRRLAARAGLSAQPSTAHALETLMHKNVIANILFMANDEMETVGDSIKVSDLRAVEDKLVFYFGQDDDWVNPDDITAIEQSFPRSKIVRCQERHRHDFVVRDDSSLRLAAVTHRWL